MKTFFLLIALILQSSTQAAEFIFEQDRSLPLVYVTVAFKGGATQDPDGKNGLTNIMANAMMRGTKSKTKQQIDASLDQLGANLAVETRAEFLAFRATVLSESLVPFLQLLSEIINTPSFRALDLERLKKEAVSQLYDELNQDRSLVKLRFDQFYFKGHPYSKSNNGRIKDVQTITAADVQQQYQKLINQNQMILLASGDAQASDFKPWLDAVTRSRNTAAPLIALQEFKNGPQKLKVVIFDKPERTQTQVMIGQTGTTYSDPNIDALQLANYSFGGGSFQSRLMVELRVKRGWTYGAGSGFKLASHPHTWKVSFFPKNADTPPAIKEALHLVSDLKEKGLSKEEFDFAKRSMINSAGFSFNTPQKRLENKLIEILFGLPDGYFKSFADRLEKIKHEEVNLALKNYLTPNRMMVGVVATAAQSKTAIAKELGISEKDIEVQDYQKE